MSSWKDGKHISSRDKNYYHDFIPGGNSHVNVLHLIPRKSHPGMRFDPAEEFHPGMKFDPAYV